MRKQHFARLELEPLEKLVLPNMLWTVSPFSFFNEATSEPPSSLGPQTPMASIRRTSTISMLLDSSQTRDGLSSVSSAVNAPSNSQTSISTFTTQNTIFFSASDDLSDPLSSDFFGIDLLVASKGGAPSFMGRNSLGPSDAGGNPSSAAADRTGQNTPPANAGAFAGIITSTSGPISLLSNLGSSANLLLPATTSAPAALSASHNGGPVSPLGGPSFGSGPNTGIGLLVLDSPQFVPVNADNDNGSGFALDSHGNTASGIPQKRDFNVAPMINAQTQQLVNDPELIWGSITAPGLPGGGVWTTTIITNVDGGKISLWANQKKTASFSPPGTFYIEGDHESKALNDVTLEFDYFVIGVHHTISATLTVTPVINTFGVTVAGGVTGQNINYTSGTNGDFGLKARPPDNTLGASFKATLTVNAMPGRANFVQDIVDDVNGSNGTVDKNGNRVGWLYNDNNGVNLLPKNGSYWLLDIAFNANDPTYTLDNNYTAPNGTGTLTADDAPETGAPVDSDQGIAVDVLAKFQLYLVWQYTNNNTAIYYPLAYTHWQVNFWGKGIGNMPPIDHIEVLHGVTSDGPNNNTRSNDPPKAMFPNNNWIGVLNVSWP